MHRTPGAFMQIGSWPTMLAANISYSGAITVSAGTLEATANSAASVNIGARRHQHNERDYDPCRRHFRAGRDRHPRHMMLRASRKGSGWRAERMRSANPST
jgi:autotransporter-associated beta strand protein